MSYPSRAEEHSSVRREREMPYLCGVRFYRTLYGAKMAADNQCRPVWHKRRRVYEPSCAAKRDLVEHHKRYVRRKFSASGLTRSEERELASIRCELDRIGDPT